MKGIGNTVNKNLLTVFISASGVAVNAVYLLSIKDELFKKQIIYGFPEAGSLVDVEHVKLSGLVLHLGQATIESIDNEKSKYSRTMRSNSLYDLLSVRKKAGNNACNGRRFKSLLSYNSFVMSENGISLKWYVSRRLLESIVLIFAVISVTFLMIHTAPGDPIDYLIPPGSIVTPEYVEMMREKLGLNRPLVEQFIDHVTRILKGDLGVSYLHNIPVIRLILERVPATFLLMGTSLIVFSILAVLMGVFASMRPNSLGDGIITIASLFGYCIPSFWLGILLIFIFGFKFALFPMGGIGNRADVLSMLHHLILPATCQGVYIMAVVSRTTKSAMRETVSENFILTARSKGLDEKTVIFKHALKNSLRPILTLVGMSFGAIMSGAVLIETIFSWPGIGRLLFESILSRDYPTLLGLFTFSTIAVVVADLITDLVYAKIDPRVRYA